jgi:hypothetical protein
MKRLKVICGLALALLMGLAAQPAWAQRPHGGSAPPSHAPSMRAAPARQGGGPRPNARPGQRPGAVRAPYNGRPAQAQAAPHAMQRPNAGPNPAANANQGVKGLSPGVKQNLRDMSPQEQQRYMQNNERFRSLPPQQQAQIRNNLQKWNNLSPTERNAMNDRARTWQRMSPQQRQYAQSNLLPKWQSMSPQRKQIVTGRLHTLQGMSPSERQEALNDPQFMRGLSPDEQSVLRGLDSLGPGRP